MHLIVPTGTNFEAVKQKKQKGIYRFEMLAVGNSCREGGAICIVNARHFLRRLWGGLLSPPNSDSPVL